MVLGFDRDGRLFRIEISEAPAVLRELLEDSERR
jgi:hypothetical protein